MPGLMSRYFAFYQFTTGRRIITADAIAREADTDGRDDLEDHALSVAEFNREVFGVEAQWERDRDLIEGARADAAQIDNVFDRSLSAIFDSAKRWKKAGDDADPRVDYAVDFLTTFFPEGVGAVTGLSYEEQLATVDHMLQDWTSDPWIVRLDELGALPFVERAESLAGEFRHALQAPSRRQYSWDEVRAARNKGQEKMLGLFARVLGTFYGDSDDHVEARARYMAVAMDQNERIGEYYSNRRRVRDVDPETGDEINPELDDLPTDEQPVADDPAIDEPTPN